MKSFYGGAAPLPQAKNLEHHLGGKSYYHAHGAPYGLGLRLPLFARFPSIFRTNRKRLNLLAIILNIIVPWVTFTMVLALFSFSIYYHNPVTCWVGAFLIFMLTAGCSYCSIWLQKVKREVYEDEDNEDGPMWYAFLLIMCVVAIGAGVLLGIHNFETRMANVYNYQNLHTYRDIDPKDYVGEQLPDAGMISFTKDTYLRTNYSMGFKDYDVYCVAPIVSPRITQWDNYDFWAVGKNCCSGVSADFHCEGFNDASIHGGLRLLNEADRPFYRLATQQAEATYFINSHRPIFFEWTRDPEGHVKSIKHDGMNHFVVCMISGLCFQIFFVITCLLVFAKVYPMRDEEERLDADEL